MPGVLDQAGDELCDRTVFVLLLPNRSESLEFVPALAPLNGKTVLEGWLESFEHKYGNPRLIIVSCMQRVTELLSGTQYGRTRFQLFHSSPSSEIDLVLAAVDRLGESQTVVLCRLPFEIGRAHV